MALYTQGGDRKWHAVAHETKVQGRAAHATKCGVTIVCACPSEDRETPPVGLCALCASPSAAMQAKLARKSA